MAYDGFSYNTGLVYYTETFSAQRQNQRRAFMRPLDLLVVRRRRFI